jgi:putative ABC transport system permease protein
MRSLDVFRLAGKNLRRTKGRTALSVLGIVIGIASVITVLSVSEAAQRFIVSQISSFGSDLVFMESGSPGEIESGGIPTPFVKEVVTEGDYEALAKQPWMRLITPVIFRQDTASARGNVVNAQIVGTSEDELAMYDARVAAGIFFSADDERSARRVAVLGAGVADRLFGNEEALNRLVKINDQNFRVIGVMEEGGSRFLQDVDLQIYIPYTTALSVYGLNRIQTIVMKTTLPVDDAVEEVRTIIRERHDIDDPKDDDFRVLTQEDVIRSTEQIAGVLQLFLVSVAAISLLVGGIGIMNIMYVSVTERTREIGLRKALGARRHAILGQFLAEAIILTTVGGVLGTALGTALTWVGIAVIQQFQDGWTFMISRNGIIAGVLFSSTIGIVFGYTPARRAAGVSPIVALRYE